jgi:hypothetical protein
MEGSYIRLNNASGFLKASILIVTCISLLGLTFNEKVTISETLANVSFNWREMRDNTTISATLQWSNCDGFTIETPKALGETHSYTVRYHGNTNATRETHSCTVRYHGSAELTRETSSFTVCYHGDMKTTREIHSFTEDYHGNANITRETH